MAVVQSCGRDRAGLGEVREVSGWCARRQWTLVGAAPSCARRQWRGSGGAQGTAAPARLSAGRGAGQECWQERRALGETEEQERLRGGLGDGVKGMGGNVFL